MCLLTKDSLLETVIYHHFVLYSNMLLLLNFHGVTSHSIISLLHIKCLLIKSFLPKTYIWRYNDAAYSKLAFGPLWVEILSNILPFLDKDLELLNNTVIKGTHPPPKLALFSGHDSTVLPLLATLGEDVWDGASWAPYASVLVSTLHLFLFEST